MMLLPPLVLPLAANNIFNFKMQLNLQQDDTSWFVLLSSIVLIASVSCWDQLACIIYVTVYIIIIIPLTVMKLVIFYHFYVLFDRRSS